MIRSASAPQEGMPRVSALSFHLYGIVEGLPRRWRPPAAGVGAGSVLARPVRGLTVIATPLDAPPRPTPGALGRHEAVLAGLLDAAALLPFRFGTLVPADDFEAWLSARLGRFRSALAELRGCVEVVVRLLRLDLRDGAPEGLLGAVAEGLVERAALPRWRYQPGGRGSAAATLAFLVPRDEVPALLARIAPVASRAAGLAVVPSGPCPPYSFAPDPAAAVVSTMAG